MLNCQRVGFPIVILNKGRFFQWNPHFPTLVPMTASSRGCTRHALHGRFPGIKHGDLKIKTCDSKQGLFKYQTILVGGFSPSETY